MVDQDIDPEHEVASWISLGPRPGPCICICTINYAMEVPFTHAHMNHVDNGAS